MKVRRTKTRKGAASIYIVIFTTTLLGIIALSFVRIMLAESLRTTNYSLSQSAYNSALAGIEDAKIVLLRYQNCINKASYNSSGGKTNNCSAYESLFSGYDQAYKTSQDCGVVGKLLHGSHSSDVETLIQSRDGVDTGTIDQAYTCVKIAAYTEDFLASLNSKNTTKLIPLRSDNPTEQAQINRVQIQWFDNDNYTDEDITDSNGNVRSNYTGFWKEGNKGELTGALTSNKGKYNIGTSSASEYGNSFTDKSLVPPVIQVTMIQSANSFKMEDFYASEGISNTSKTNRGTLMLRPTRNKSNTFLTSRQISSSNHSNVLPRNSLAYSANKSFNTPLDVACDPGNSDWGTYACKADFFVPAPINAGYTDAAGTTANQRNMTTSFLVVNLPYGGPETDISVKMYHCADPNAPISSNLSDGSPNCRIIYFANVQPMVDSTGRANDLFRRVEARIELADTNFPISNYALAMTDPANKAGITKDFYVTKGCHFNDSYFDSTSASIKTRSYDCANSKKNDSGSEGKGNGEL